MQKYLKKYIMFRKTQYIINHSNLLMTFTVIWVILVCTLAALNLPYAQRPIKLNEWADFLAGFLSVPVLLWLIAGYSQKDTEIEEQRTFLKAQIKPVLAILANDVFDTDPPALGIVKLNLKIINNGPICKKLAVRVEGRQEKYSPPLPSGVTLNTNDSKEFWTFIYLERERTSVEINYSDICGNTYKELFLAPTEYLLNGRFNKPNEASWTYFNLVDGTT